MKKIFTSVMLIAAAVMTLSCSKEKKVDNPSDNLLHFTVRTAATRTYISEGTGTPRDYAVGWNQNDEIGCFTGDIASTANPNFNLTNQDPDGATATFDGVVPATESGTFQAFYPVSAFVKTYNEADGALGVTVKSTQAPSSVSFDTSADILVSQACGYVSDGANVVLDDIFFSRVLSVLRVNVKGTDAAGEKISSLKITAPAGIILTGRAKVNTVNRTIKEWTVPNNTVEGKPTEEVIINDDTFNAVYLLVNPTTIAIGSTVTISGTTDQHDFSKEITIADKDLVFPAGQIAVLNVTLASSNLSEKQGDISGEYIITGVNGDKTYAAKAWVSNDNNLKTAELTVTDEINHKFTAVDTDLKFTLAAVDSLDGYYTIQDANDMYLYAASASSNNLKASSSVTSGSEHNFCFYVRKETDGTYTVKADKSSNRNLVRFNSGANLFSCYASGQNPVTLYPYANLTVEILPKIVSVSPTSLTWTDADGTAPKTITVTTENSTTIAVNPTTHDDFTIAITDGNASDGTAEITVTPNAAAGDAAREATLSITASNATHTSAATTVPLTQQSSSAPSTVTDVFTLSTFVVTAGKSYTNVSGISVTSPAVYSANLAGGTVSGTSGTIQLRATNPSGIVTTTSGGDLKSVKITFNTNTASSRKVDIYGKTTAYSAPADLYDSTKQGTKIGTVTYASGTDTYNITVTDSYQHIGLRSASGALYLDGIEIEWE